MEALLILVAITFLFLVILKNKKYPSSQPEPFNLSSDQLRIVSQHEFYKRKLMSKEEFFLFKKLESILENKHPGFRVFPQVALGEVMGAKNDATYRCINSKRADFIIISRFGDPVAVIEYQGSGHYQGNAIERDAVKKEACRRAGIAYHEVVPGYNEHDLDLLLRHIQ